MKYIKEMKGSWCGMNDILMNKNTEILKFSYDEETHTILKIEKESNSQYVPPGIVEYKLGISRKAFNDWWRDRSIPASQSKFQEVMDDLNITSSLEVLERCFGWLFILYMGRCNQRFTSFLPILVHCRYEGYP